MRKPVFDVSNEVRHIPACVVVTINFPLDYYFCFVVAICDLVHDVETIFHLSYLLTAYGSLS